MKTEPTQTEPAKQAKRLCSEIQLFDLCDLERCGHKDGRFCTDEDLLARFEHIPEEDDSDTTQLDFGESDEDEDGEGDEFGYGDEAEEDPYAGERDDWEE